MIDRAVRGRDAWAESLICLPPSGREKSRDRARAKGRREEDIRQLLANDGCSYGARWKRNNAPRRAARCQRKYAPRVFQNTLANVPGPIDQEITGNDIRASLCSTGGVRENLTLSRLPVSSLSKHVIFLWERVFRTNYHCLLFFPLIVERCKFNFLQMCCMFFFKKHLRV